MKFEMGVGMDDLENLRAGVLKHISEVSDEGELENLRLRFLGKKGEISLKMRELGSMNPEQKMTYGPLLNSLKDEINSALIAKKTAFQDTALDERLRTEWLDVTLPGRVRGEGTIHPVSQVTDEVTEIFADMGFLVAEGPQIESDWYNFDALNIPSHHPARGEMDTFYMKHPKNSNEPPHVLRTHTSPVQIRTMQSSGAPIKVICPGRVYRADYDQTHTPMFHQVEGLIVDKEASFSQLKGLLIDFLRAYFEKDDLKVRFRPSYFPFTEPSAEADIECVICGGEGCRVCKKSGWLEVLGCGVVHPNVLTAVNIDPNEFSGLAFGMGVERLAMLRYSVNDLRLFFENDVRFLNQF